MIRKIFQIGEILPISDDSIMISGGFIYESEMDDIHKEDFVDMEVIVVSLDNSAKLNIVVDKIEFTSSIIDRKNIFLQIASTYKDKIELGDMVYIESLK